MKGKLLIVTLFIASLVACNTKDTSNNTKWKSYTGDKTIEKRVDSLLALMTLEEKLGQMTQFSGQWTVTGPVVNSDVEPYLKKGQIGSLLNVVTVDGIKKMQDLAMSESRLKIPLLIGYDVVHGYHTIFPMPLAEACSWDLALMKRSAEIAAEEASAEGVHWTFAPMVDVAHDPRWGRVMEGAGEDPYLGSLIAEARVKGFQGDSWKSLSEGNNRILACAKHFAAYGAAEGGRDYNTAEISDRTLREIYLPPFQAAVDAGVATFMTAFNDINGVPCTANKYLYTDILRNEWDFKGFVVTDYTATDELVPHGIAKDQKHAAELAANAGVEMDMVGGAFYNLVKSVEEGKVSMTVVDRAVKRILEMKFMLGLFEDPYRGANQDRLDTTSYNPQFMETARDAVRKSVVLLKNDKNVFPIEKSKNITVALIGPMVKDKSSMNGEWQGQGDRTKSVSLLEGITEKYAGSNVKFITADGCDLLTTNKSGFAEALSVARRADVVIAAMGEDFNWTGEAASKTRIEIPETQKELLKELAKLGKPLGLVLFNGRPLDLSWEAKNVDAIMEAWYPGTQAGHGVADVISGDYNPAGRLVMAFPRTVGQLPMYYNHKSTGRPIDPADPKVDYRSFYIDEENTPLYPFGYGLSYTTFAISDVKADKQVMSANETLTVTAKVSNTGTKDGDLITQLYIRDLVGSVVLPVKALKGFEKVALKAGESKTVTFEVTKKHLEMLNIDMERVVEPGDFVLWVAQHSEDNSNSIKFEVK